jgi:hypothetical protein
MGENLSPIPELVPPLGTLSSPLPCHPMWNCQCVLKVLTEKEVLNKLGDCRIVTMQEGWRMDRLKREGKTDYFALCSNS